MIGRRLPDFLMTDRIGIVSASVVDSPKAWLRLVTAMLFSTVGAVGMWSVVVALPAIQAEFGVDRAAASLPYTMVMLGFAGGGVVAGRLADRFGIMIPLDRRHLRAFRRLPAGRASHQPVAGRARARAADRLRLLGHLRPADGRHLALVHAPARHRRGARCLAAIISAAPSGRRWCSISLPPTDGARRIPASDCSASSPCCRWL